jgi:hypothetical protein
MDEYCSCCKSGYWSFAVTCFHNIVLDGGIL